MQILSKFYHYKHLTHYTQLFCTHNAFMTRYFTYHNAQMRCYSTVLLFIFKNRFTKKFYKLKGYQQNYKQTILP